MFGKGGKIIVTLKPVGPTQVQGGPIAASGFNYLRFVFKNGGEEDVSPSFCVFMISTTFSVL